MIALFIINTFWFFFLSFLWKKSDWYNFIIKIVLFFTGCANAFFAMQLLGYVVRV